MFHSLHDELCPTNLPRSQMDYFNTKCKQIKLRILDNPPDFTTTYLPIIVATITGLVGTGLGVYNFIQGQRDRKPKFEQFQRKKDTVGRWYIYVHSPSKPIRKCSATFKGQKLSIRDGKGFKKNVVSGSGCNFDMPNDVSENDDGVVLIKSGRRTIEKSKFNEMEATGG